MVGAGLRAISWRMTRSMACERSRAGGSCFVIPAFDAAHALDEVLHELTAELAEFDRERFIVVDDGSTDRTAAIADEHGVNVLKHGKNRGKGAAIFTGLVEAERRGFSSIVTVDADGQHPASSARKVLEAGADGDLVLGIRDLVRDGAPKANQMSNGISNFFISYFGGRKLGDTQCGLRRYPVRETLALGAHAHGYAFEAEVLLLAMASRMPILEVPIDVRYPPEEERVTHFDSVKDPARIVAVVVRTLWSLRARSTESSVQPEGE